MSGNGCQLVISSTLLTFIGQYYVIVSFLSTKDKKQSPHHLLYANRSGDMV